MLGSPSVRNHAVEATLLPDNSLESGGNALLTRHIAVLEIKTARITLEKCVEGLTRLGDIETEDGGGIVGEANLCDAEANTLVGSSDWEMSIRVSGNMGTPKSGYTH